MKTKTKTAKKSVLYPLLLLGVVIGISIWADAQSALAQPPPPNVLLIVSDDQRYDTMAYMPQTMALIFEQGVSFERAYVTTARCCPSRASILTGLYAHNHNVRVNRDKLRAPTMVEALDANGYFTGLVGKYLNSYPTNPDDPPLPEFDYWVGMISGPQNALYFDTKLNVNGTWRAHEGYQTEILEAYALEFLQMAAAEPDPFFLLFTPYAPHIPALPAPGDESLYTAVPPHRPPSFNPQIIENKPVWLQVQPTLDVKELERLDAERLNQLQSLAALDRTVARLIAALEQQGELDNTIVFYLSDNGLFWGEHRLLFEKSFVYEEAVRVPFAVRFPPLTLPHKEVRLAANIDIAPTIYDLTGVAAPQDLDGRSLRPLLQNDAEAPWRDYLLIEGWPSTLPTVAYAPPFQAIHTGDMVYVETRDEPPELYDLRHDPYQMQNSVNDPLYAETRTELQTLLQNERLQAPLDSGEPTWRIRLLRTRYFLREFQTYPLIGSIRVWHLLLPGLLGMIGWLLLRIVRGRKRRQS